MAHSVTQRICSGYPLSSCKGSYNPDVASHCVNIEQRSFQYPFDRDPRRTPHRQKSGPGTRFSEIPKIPDFRNSGPESGILGLGPSPGDPGDLISVCHSLTSMESDPICAVQHMDGHWSWVILPITVMNRTRLLSNQRLIIYLWRPRDRF